MPQIRPATVDDTPLLVPLVKSYWSFEEIPGFDQDRVAAQLARLLSESQLGCGWIALDENGHTAVGYLLAVYVFSLEYLGLTAEIDEFFVLPDHRGQGLGVEMLEAAEKEFVRAGCTKVSLQLSRDNEPARAFYRRHGYAQRSGFELLDKTLTSAAPARNGS